MGELKKSMTPQKRYVDDTITYIKSDFITQDINIMNENIKFIYDIELNIAISFLDVLLINNGKLKTTVFRGIYLHWRSFPLITWKKTYYGY